MTAETVNQVFEFFLTAQTYSDIFIKYISNKIERDEFQQFIYLMLLEKSDKTIKAWNEGYFKYYFIQIINNNVKSKNSPWHVKYRKHRFENIDDMFHLSVIEKEEEKFNPIPHIAFIISKNLKKEPGLIRDFTLWKMYYLKKETFQTIAEKTNIPYSSVRNYIKSANSIIKKELKELIKLNNN